jgi:8-oxo-dGTP pyrophosphatase MutT (NUDIX family)
MDDELAHHEALRTTGFWGAQGAGLLFFARRTRRFLLAHRSEYVQEPGTWGTWGGAIDKGDSPEAAARREASEECGLHSPILQMVPLLVFQSGTFRYSNFLGIIEDEFVPELNWESQGFQWCRFGRWPRPLHPGLKALFADAASVEKMKALAGA